MTNYESAIPEITKIEELLQALRELPMGFSTPLTLPASTTWPEFVEGIFDEVGRCLETAVSLLKPGGLESPPGSGRRSSNGDLRGKKKRSTELIEGDDGFPDKRRKRVDSWVTQQPHEDGYLWRKYGEKPIQGAKFLRSYYKCTLKRESGCMATKQVQRASDGDASTFLVTYRNEHTCQPKTTTTVTPMPIMACETTTSPLETFVFTNSESPISIGEMQQEGVNGFSPCIGNPVDEWNQEDLYSLLQGNPVHSAGEHRQVSEMAVTVPPPLLAADEFDMTADPFLSDYYPMIMSPCDGFDGSFFQLGDELRFISC